MPRTVLRLGCLALAVAFLSTPVARTQAHSGSLLNSLAAAPSISVSVVAGNGDQNPYGVALVPHEFPGGGSLRPGDILVSDFNNAHNLQGMGSSVVVVTPAGVVSTFFAAPTSLGPVGLTTALVALRSGLVVVGNTPTLDGTSATVSDGGLLFLGPSGRILMNLVDSALLRGPWDLAADDSDPDDPILYVSSVLSGTVTRINVHVTASGSLSPRPEVESMTLVASGFAHRTDPAALVIGPTGLLLSHDLRDLYVADTGNNRLQLIGDVREARSDRRSGTTVVSGAPLRGPLGLAWSPRGTIVLSNGDAAGDPATPPNLVVEVNPESRTFVSTRQLDAGAAGGIFGVAIGRVSGRTSLLYADDNTNTLDVLPPL